MKDRNSFKNRFKDWLNQLTPSQLEDAEMLWEQAEKTDDSRRVSVSDQEKEQVFAEISAQTEIGKEKPAKNIDRSTWKWVAAAAVIILAAGLGYLTIPVTVYAPYGKTASVTLRDGTEITLNSGTTVTYSRLYGYLERVITLEGEAYFDVQKGNQPFSVHTSNATVTVLGTAFNLRSWPEDTGQETTVTLEEGSLAFYALGNAENSVLLKPGEQSTLHADLDKPTSPHQVETNRSLAWMDSRFAFEEQTLTQIIKEIERRFNLSISIQPESIRNDTLTIYYSKEVGAEQIIQDICQSKALNFRKVNGGYVIESR